VTPTPDDFRLLRRLNWVMTLAVLLLVAIGVLFVYSACFVSPEQPVRTLYRRQIMWAFAGLFCYVGFAAYDYHKLGKLSWLLYSAGILLLVLVLFMGTSIYGAKRWLMVFNIGIQPSELAKLTTLIAVATFMSRPTVSMEQPRAMATVTALALLPMALVVIEPDLGTTMVYLPMVALCMFAGGLPLRLVGTVAALFAVVLALLLSALFLPEKLDLNEQTQERFQRMTGLSDYQKNRIVGFFQPDKDPLGVGWNKRQSEIAVGSGGPWGKGFTKGTQNILGFLPRSVAPTDFIYSVIAEEMGFFGSSVVLFLFGVILVSGLRTAIACRDMMGRILCVGVVAMLFAHVFVNIAMTIGLMPITGLPLPLLSYGGSFMLVTMSALGIIQSVHIRTLPPASLVVSLGGA